MAETRDFPTDEVLTAVTGIMMAPRGIGAVYELLNWASDDDLFTHQLGRVMGELRAIMLARQPELQQARDEASRITPENVHQWRRTWIDRYGPTITVPRLTEDEHERIDPLSELAERVPPDRIVVVTDGGEG